MRAMAWLSTAIVSLSSPAALADCSGIWLPGAIVVTYGGYKTNITTTRITTPSGADGGILFTPADPGVPARLPDALIANALIAAKARPKVYRIA